MAVYRDTEVEPGKERRRDKRKRNNELTKTPDEKINSGARKYNE